MAATLYAVKPKFQSLLRRCADRLTAQGVSADALTVIGLNAAAIAGGIVAVIGTHPSAWLLVVPPLLFVRIACNALDGMVARSSGTARPWGGVLNEVGDRVADLLCFGGLVIGGTLPAIVAGALLPLILLVSYLGIIGQSLGGGRCYAGPLGKADRMLILAAYCCLAPFTSWAAPVIGWSLLGGLALTTINRLRATRLDLARR